MKRHTLRRPVTRTDDGLHGVGSAGTPRRGRRRFLRIVVPLGITVAIFGFALPQFADLSVVWATITAMTWLEVASLVAASAWNIVTYQLVMISVLPGLRLSQAFLVGQTSTAVSSTLPAGSAIGIGVTYSMYASMGRSGTEVGLATVLTGVWNNFLKLGLPIVALALVAFSGEATAAELGIALLGVAALAGAIGVLAAMLSSPRLARRLGGVAASAVTPLRRLARRPPARGWDEAAVRFRSDTIHLLRHRWLLLTVATLISHLSLYLVLVLALRHVGVASSSVTALEALVVFAVTRLVTALPITPGGLGVTELALTGALVLAGGGHNPVVAAVLVFRLLTFVIQVPIGGLCYLYWQSRALVGERGESAGSGRNAVAPP